jgi:hypothetical protein
MPLRALEMEERWVVQRWWPPEYSSIGRGWGRQKGRSHRAF